MGHFFGAPCIFYVFYIHIVSFETFCDCKIYLFHSKWFEHRSQVQLRAMYQPFLCNAIWLHLFSSTFTGYLLWENPSQELSTTQWVSLSSQGCLVVTICDIRLLHHLLILSLDHAPRLFYESLWPPLFTLAHRPLTHHISDHLWCFNWRILFWLVYLGFWLACFCLGIFYMRWSIWYLGLCVWFFHHKNMRICVCNKLV